MNASNNYSNHYKTDNRNHDAKGCNNTTINSNSDICQSNNCNHGDCINCTSNINNTRDLCNVIIIAQKQLTVAMISTLW